MAGRGSRSGTRGRAVPTGAVLLAAACLTACGGDGAPGEGPPPAAEESLVAAASPQDAFWAALLALCGQAYGGRIVEDVGGDGGFQGQALVMHVRECTGGEVRVPFHVGENRSRTWVFTRTAEGLRLKHDHRHEDGTEDEVTQYGGDTAEAGTPESQTFPADAFTSELLPAAATNVWTVEVRPGSLFAYTLRREGTERRFRVEFDLAAPVTAPPAPWGS